MKYTREDIRKAMLLYAVTDRTWLKEGEDLADVCEKVLENGATFIQIREKVLDKDAFENEAKKVISVCRKKGVPCVVNDSVELAMEWDADGVHVGQSDIKGRDIRAILGPDKILGITAATVEQAIAAEKAGADYIGSGAVFATSTKSGTKSLPYEKLQEICDSVSIPVVAIGGINGNNMMQLKGSGIAGTAIVSAIFAAEEPGKATAALLEKSKKLI